MSISVQSLFHSALIVGSLTAVFVATTAGGGRFHDNKGSALEGPRRLSPDVMEYATLRVETSYGVEISGDWVTTVDLRGPDIIWQYWESVHPSEKDGARGFTCEMIVADTNLSSGNERNSKRDSREAFFDSSGKCQAWLSESRYQFLGADKSPSVAATALADVLNLPQVVGRGWALQSVVHFAPQEVQRFLGARIMVVLSRSSGD